MTANDGSGGNNSNEGDDLNFPAGTWTGCCGFYQPSYSLGNAFKVTATGYQCWVQQLLRLYHSTAVIKLPVHQQLILPNYDVTPLATDHGLKFYRSVHSSG